jgi:hypothetical protein
MKNPIRRTVVATAAAVMAMTFAVGAMAQETSADPFTIALPAGFSAFAKQSQTVKTKDGKDETITNWVSKAPTGEAVVVTVSKMPGKILDPENMMSKTRDSVVKSLNATVESDDKLAGDVPSEQVLFYSGTNAFLRARLAVKDASLYQLLYVGRSADQRAAPAVEELFGSFKINPAVAGAPQSAATSSH